MPADRVVRRLPKNRELPLDEQPWVVQSVLAAWAGLMSVIVVALGGFDDPSIFRNAIARLAGVAIVWAMLALYFSERRIAVGRRMRLALATSLIVHTLLALVLVALRLELLQIDLPDELTLVERQPVEQPQVVLVNQPPPVDKPLFERPLPTEQLSAQTPQVTRERKEATQVEVSETTAPSPTELAETPAPNLQASPRSAAPLARRAPATGERSRQTSSASLAQASGAESVAAAAASATEEVAAKPETQLAKREATPDRSTEPTTEVELARAPLAAARADQPMAQQPAVAQTRNRQASSAALAQTNVEPLKVAATPPESTPAANADSRQRVERQVAASPTTDTPAIEVDLPQREAPTEMARRNTQVPEVRLARSPRREPRSGPVELAMPSEQQLQTAQSAAIADMRAEQIAEATPTALPRSAQFDQASDVQPVESPLPPAPSANFVRSERTVEQPVPKRDDNRLRPTEVAGVVSGQASPAVGIASAQEDSTLPEATSPAPRALANTRGGTADAGEAMNAANDSPAAPTYVAPFALAAAQRPRATQTKLGTDLAPVPTASRQRGRASAELPSSTLRAEAVPQAQVAGTSRPQETNASSSAARSQQFANVALGDLNADAGQANVDTGPPQITPRAGSGRGSSGGRSMRLANSETGGVARRGGGGPQADNELQANQVAGSSGPAPPASSAGSQSIASRTRRASGSATNRGPGNNSASPVRRLQLGDGPVGMVSGGGQIETIAADSGDTTGSPSAGEPNTAPVLSQLGSNTPRRAPGSGDLNSDQAGNAAADVAPLAATAYAPMPRASGNRRGNLGANSPATAARAERRPTLDVAGSLAQAQPSAVDQQPAIAAAPTGGNSSTQPGTTPGVGRLATSASGVARQTVSADLPEAAGGLLDTPSIDIGLPTRVARADSRMLTLTPSRFAGSSRAGRTGSGRQSRPAPAFASRGRRQIELLSGGTESPTPTSEEAIELGLRFLAGAQQADGRWSLDYFGPQPVSADEMPIIEADAAATGLALLAFLGAGYDHFSSQYRQTVAAGIDFLLESQADSGELLVDTDPASTAVTRFYGHGIAALALCEAYGMTGDPRLAEPAQRSLDFIMKTQQRQLGGWRYSPGEGSDLSVTGWQLMALRSGELAGLDVDRRTYERIGEFLELCREQDGNRARFCYNPQADPRIATQRHGRRPGTVMTSVGLLVQLYLGEGRDSPRAQQGADHLLANLPTANEGTTEAPISTLGNPLRDTYYWYYGTQVMFHMRGEYWQRWHEALHPLLVDTQTKEGPLAGSWNPRHPAPDKWARHAGRLYVTTMNLLSLEVSYRHLPLYEMTAE